MNKTLISVIIPVYNMEKYLCRCMESVLKQTYSNLEIFLIDDGSKDQSAKMCDDYALKDERIKVIHQENGGLSNARNTGLKLATGEYITFLDSDDYVNEKYIEYLYQLLEQYNGDISICGMKRFEEECCEEDTENDDLKKVYGNIEALEILCYQKGIANSAWGKMYKRSLFEDIRYPEGMLYEDLAVIYKLLYKAEKVVQGNKKYYYYMQRRDSIMHQNFSKRSMDRIKVSSELLDYVRVNCPEILDAANARFFISNIQVLREIPHKDGEYQEELNYIKKNIKLYRKKVILDTKAKKITRLIAGMSCLNVSIMQKLGAVYKFFEK